MKHVNVFSILVVTIFASFLLVPETWGKPFADARMIFETNATDGDAGIQIFLDADPWNVVKIFGPNGQQIFEVQGKGNLQGFGLTELFSESNEPPFEEFPLQDVLNLFPAGKYEFRGTAVDGAPLKSVATLTHVIPCGPEIISPAVLPVTNARIEWNTVVNELDHDTGQCGFSTNLTIAGYQVIVGDFQIILPADATGVTVPPEFLEPNTLHLFEVLAIEEGGNQTITESSFTTQ
jgi:hypothetical protein